MRCRKAVVRLGVPGSVLIASMDQSVWRQSTRLDTRGVPAGQKRRRFLARRRNFALPAGKDAESVICTDLVILIR